ncbi:GNAT family N-acetyltransferase [Actinoplanes sp. TBRC 11911]|uniref:GNAT family N-acetyltransferase n=1 Tax=Actinoplanes sp. TBRC 11911 TaxID=2729386 RepID=UPI00145EF18A|nr:GNAT family N-acetyltransferase [Actinoplanes sp. TBRC 11911]NMO52779.1 GNAT family N-acetyltransferase [Actinoplanes sp. TBRC 11911]
MIRLLDRPGDLGWVVLAHGELYATEYGVDATFEALAARIMADFAAAHDPAREAGWIAEIDGRRAGCVLCVDAHEDATAVLRVLLVDPAARGHGVGGALIDTCVRFARAAGYARMRLWTIDHLAAARRLYEKAGFQLVGEEPNKHFGVGGNAQTYQLELI